MNAKTDCVHCNIIKGKTACAICILFSVADKAYIIVIFLVAGYIHTYRFMHFFVLFFLHAEKLRQVDFAY